jgi:anti-sigma regulatory factor (Ser/Thr protein kinase)
MVRISDQGSGPPEDAPEAPDLDAKLAGRQSPRGWGLFLIQEMVDRVNVVRGDSSYTLELVLFREGQDDLSS